jgi:hypothetical protein
MKTNLLLRVVTCFGVLCAMMARGSDAQLCPGPSTVTALPTSSTTLSVPTGSGVLVTAGGPQIRDARVFRVVGTGHRYRLTTCGLTTQDTIISVTRSCAAPFLGSVVANNDDFCSGQSQLEFDAQAGVEYLIVAGWFSTPTASYTMALSRLSVAAPLADGNATCAGATQLLANDTRGNELVVSAAQPQGNWYSLNVQNSTTLTLQACAIVGDPLIEVLSGCGGAIIASNDDGGGSCTPPYSAGGASRLVLTLEAGTYLIRAGSYQGTPTTGLLTTTVALPPGVLTYQGRLDDEGVPANGLFDVRFNFYTSPISTLLRGTYTAPSVPVVDGLFTVEIPYLSISGVTFDTDRFFDVAVRRTGGPGFVTLAPRQQVGVAPLARVALNAPAGPQGPQGVPGAAGPAGAAGAAGPAGPAGASPFTLSGANAVYTAGNVAVGTSNANARLRVDGIDPGTGHSLNVADTLYTVPGFVGVGRATQVTGAERFGIGSATAGYAGMYITTPLGGLPFYGYTSGPNTAWTYLDEADNWRLYNSGAGEIFAIAGNGNTGIKVSPSATFTLDVGGSVRCTTLTQTSSARYKDEVRNLSRGLEELMKIRPVEFLWNDLAPEDVRTKHDLGVLAEELATVLPEAVARDAKGVAVGVDYSRLTVLSVRAIQELREINEAQRRQLVDLEARLRALEADRDRR